MVKVLVNGPSSWNMLVDLDELPPAHPHMVIANGHRWGLGGTSAGKALGLARLGIPTTLRTVLGTDPDAEKIRAAVQHPGLTLIDDVVDGPSEHHLNLMSASGGRVSIYLDQTGAADALPTALADALTAADIAVIDLTASSLPVLGAARRAGCEIWCDLHDFDGRNEFHRPFIEAADVLLVSADRLPDPHAFLRQRVDAGTSLAICTMGAAGARAVSTTEGDWWVSAVPVDDVVDTNGAGDAFLVGLLAARLDGRSVPDGLRWAAAAGAIAVQSTDLVSPRLSRRAVRALAPQCEVSPD
ncbi:MAG: carbohydrate kinase family protein [Nakamurella sp.]